FAEVRDRPLMIALTAIGEAAVVKSIGVCGIEPNGFAVIGKRAVPIATTRVKIAAMHVPRGVSGVSADRLDVILHGLVEIALALPLIGAVAVDEREITLVEPAGTNETRAGLDSRIAGSTHAFLAILRCRWDHNAGGRQPGENVFLKEQHQTPPLFGQGLSA